jgi:hypothetical protein
MAKPKMRAFRFELAICIGVPIVVLLAIAIPGYFHIRTVKNEIQMQQSLLDEIPVIDSRLSMMKKILVSYRVKNGGKDKIGELSQLVNKTAIDQNIKVKSVNAEKVVLPDSSHSMDYHVAMSGEGGLVGAIRMMDTLDQNTLCFKVASLKMRAKSFMPQPVYDAEWQFQYRYLPSKISEARAPSGGGAELFKRMGVAIDELNGFGKDKGTVLNTAKLESRKVVVTQEPVFVEPEKPMLFRLNGIAEDGRGPLALTDRGVFGVGDSIDGCKIVKVAKDHIVVESKKGRREMVSLYKSEASP